MAIRKPEKAKGAERVIEVLDYFDEQHRHATVMDIARRYDRPQSSTSELLANLVRLGLLYKDHAARTYSLTPRAAVLGSLSQPRVVRDGSLARLIDDLRGQTGLGVVLVGMNGTNAQVFRWKPGLQRLETSDGRSLAGAQDRLQESVAGWLLLSTLPPQRREGLIRRLNAEAPGDRKFNPAELSARIEECAQRGFAIGALGFGTAASIAAILFAPDGGDHPMALGFVHEPVDANDGQSLVAVLQRFARRAIESGSDSEPLRATANAA
jgi:DNA-binding IclR family transcriptional regulator